MINFAPDDPIALFLEPPPLRQMALQALSRGRNLKQSEIDRFRDLGIAAINLSKSRLTQVDRVTFNGEYFVFVDDDDGGEQAFTMAVISWNGLIDAVAWHPCSGHLATYLGLGFALGEYQIGDYVDNDSAALAVFRSPLGWLRAGCEGIVIVRKTFAHIVLKRVPLLLAEDESHRSELAEMFPFGGLRILVRGLEDPAAIAELEVAV
jgi:hypothetical protein